MPKEIVRAKDRPFTDVSSAESVVGVQWSKDIYVAVFTELFNDDLKYMDGHGNIHVAEGEEAERRKIRGEGFYVHLDRGEINRLIRNLRRARDQAFGRDE